MASVTRLAGLSLALAALLIHGLWIQMSQVICVVVLPLGETDACQHTCCEPTGVAQPPTSPSGQPHRDCCIQCPADHWCRIAPADRIAIASCHPAPLAGALVEVALAPASEGPMARHDPKAPPDLPLIQHIVLQL
jgi:hypothetical protein